MASGPSDADVLARVDALAEEMLQFLAAAVRCPTVSGWEDRAGELCTTWFEARGWHVERQPLAGTRAAAGEPRAEQRENLIARYPRGRTGKQVVLNGHLDVVPVTDEARWTHPPFEGVRADGAVHGRGAVDMKGGIAAGLYALAALQDCGWEPNFDMVVELVAAEETSGAGTRAAFERVTYPAAAIVLEPTGGVVVPLNTGLLFFTVEVTGRSAHTSSPWQGVDAFDHLVRLREALADFARLRGQRYSHPLFAAVPTAVPFAVGTVRAGRWRAAVPDYAVMSGRIGVAPGEALDQVRHDFQEVVDRVGAEDDWLRVHPPTVHWEHDGLPGWETSQDHPLVASFLGAQHALTATTRLAGFTAGSDAAHFGGRGIPTLVYGPGDVAKAHGPDECVPESDVVRAAEVVALALLRLMRTGWGR